MIDNNMPYVYRNVNIDTVRGWMRILSKSSDYYRMKLSEFDAHPESELIWKDLTEHVQARGIDTIEEFIRFMED